MEDPPEHLRTDEIPHQQIALNHHFYAMEENGIFPANENENILAVVGAELAEAGDELTRRYSRHERRRDVVWDNIKLYAFIVTFRLMLRFV